MTEKQWDNPPAMQIDPQKPYRVTIETNRGDMELELYPEYAPKTVNNFVFLAQEGFYDGLATTEIYTRKIVGSVRCV